MSKRRSWAAIAALVVASGVVTVGLCEVALRVFGLAPPPGLFTVTEKEFERVPGIFKPNQRVVEQQGTEFEHSTTIDSLGYRGADFPRARAPGEMRVFYAGDSFTWGHNVEDDETTPAQLQVRLRELCGPVTVVNGGMSGSTILEEQAMIERGLTLDPTVVLLMYHENDMGELINNRIWEQLAINRARKSRPPLSLVYPWLRHSAIWNLAQEVLRARRIETAGNAVMVHGEAPAGEPEAREEYRTRLAAIAQLLSQRGVPFVFGAFPHPESVRAGHGGEDYPWVLEAATTLGIPTIDLIPTFMESGVSVERAFLLPRDYHPTAAGHGVAAAHIAEVLSENPAYGCRGA